MEKRKTALNWLYPRGFDSRHIEISKNRQKDTGGWLLDSPELLGWSKGCKKPLLWGHGIRKYRKSFPRDTWDAARY